MNFYEYWMQLPSNKRNEIFFQKAIPIKDVEDLKRIIDRNEENSLIAISYSKLELSRKLGSNIYPVNGNLFANLKYKISEIYNNDGEPQQKTQLKYNINHFKFNHYHHSPSPFAFDYASSKIHRNKEWPQQGLEYYYESNRWTNPQEIMDENIFQFLQSQGGISFQIRQSYWKIVSLFPNSKTPFLNWNGSEPWEVKE